MRSDDLDRVLSTADDIVPSSGFVSGVMAAVRAEAQSPAPIPFPWTRMLIGLSACTAAIAAMAITSASLPASAGSLALVDKAWEMVGPAAARVAQTRETQLVVGALALTYFLVEIPRKVLRW